MKITPILLTVSLAGSAALLVALFASPPAASSSASATAPANVSTAKSTGANVAPKEDIAGVDRAFWPQTIGADLATQVARLRAAGFPPAVVRVIIASQLSEKFAAQRKALTPPTKPTEFWKNEPPVDPKVRAALNELSLQQARQLTELVGPNTLQPGINSLYDRRQYAGVPPDKIEAFARVKRDYDEMRSEIYAGVNGTLSPEDQARIAFLEKEQRTDTAALFTPAEMELYDLTTSNTAAQMRYQLGAFQPNEAEFRAIFQLQRVFDEKYQLTTAAQAGNQAFMQQRTAAQKELTDQIKATLGSQRGADYERATDPNFQQIFRVTARLGLPTSSAAEAFAVQKDIQQRLQNLQTARPLNLEARNAELAKLNDEATTRLSASLGQRGFDVYKQNGGVWLQNLQPRVAVPSPSRGAVPAPGAPIGGRAARGGAAPPPPRTGSN